MGMVRLESQRAREALEGGRDIHRSHQGFALRIPRPGLVGIECQRSIEGGNGLGPALQSREQVALILPGQEIVGLQRKGECLLVSAQGSLTVRAGECPRR